jgi:hypothetical protein
MPGTNRQLMVSALRTTKSKPSYDGPRMTRVNLATAHPYMFISRILIACLVHDRGNFETHPCLPLNYNVPGWFIAGVTVILSFFEQLITCLIRGRGSF